MTKTGTVEKRKDGKDLPHHQPSPLHHLTLYLLYMRVRHRLMTHPPVLIFKCQYLKFPPNALNSSSVFLILVS